MAITDVLCKKIKQSTVEVDNIEEKSFSGNIEDNELDIIDIDGVKDEDGKVKIIQVIMIEAVQI